MDEEFDLDLGDESIPESHLSYEASSVDFSTINVDVEDLREQPDVKYPAVLLTNVIFKDCLNVLQSVKKASYREMDIWILTEDPIEFSNIGTLQMDSDMLLLLRHLGIAVTMYYDKDTVEPLDLEDPNVIEKFI